MKKIILVFVSLISVKSFAEKSPVTCQKGEEVFVKCTNPNAGWGIDEITINVCKNISNETYSLEINRKIFDSGNSINTRVSTEIRNLTAKQIDFVTFDYTVVYRLSYFPKLNKAHYNWEVGNNSFSAKLDCE